MVTSICETAAAHENGRDIRFNIHDLPLVKGDGHLLGAVWENFVSNAVKFTRNTAHAQIEIGWLEQNGMLVFYTRDNGVGFNMQYYSKLFQPFQRLHTQAEFEGNGIGLATAKRIVGSHGGTIWAESEPGKGSCFYFSLPKQ
jgi:light-regulated signal transduction histidine kinase (bacteriophytochrome)